MDVAAQINQSTNKISNQGELHYGNIHYCAPIVLSCTPKNPRLAIPTCEGPSLPAGEGVLH
jgi:hypothetical protein